MYATKDNGIEANSDIVNTANQILELQTTSFPFPVTHDVRQITQKGGGGGGLEIICMRL